MTDLDPLVGSWHLSLKAERKSPKTIESYLTGVRAYLGWCDAQGLPRAIDRRAVNGWVAAMLDDGAAANTARIRQLAVRRFSAWLAEEGEAPTDPLLGLKQPKLDEKVMQALDADQLARLFKACAGRDFKAVRDMALFRLMAECGLRGEEALSMDLTDVDTATGTAIVRRGKGGKGRVVYFGPTTSVAVDRYIRTRRSHKLAATGRLWLGDQSKAFAVHQALAGALLQRVRQAGLPSWVTPHTLRRTFATRWRDAGGSETGLMAAAGWARMEMVQRYTRASKQRQAIDEAKRLGLGDV